MYARMGGRRGLMEQLVEAQQRYHESARLRKGVSVVEKGTEICLLRHSWSGQLQQLARHAVEKSVADHGCECRCYDTSGMVARGVPDAEVDADPFRLATACASPAATVSVLIHGNGSRSNRAARDSMTIQIESPHLHEPLEQTYRVEWRTACERGQRVCCIPARRIQGVVDQTIARENAKADDGVISSSLVTWGGGSGYERCRG